MDNTQRLARALPQCRDAVRDLLDELLANRASKRSRIDHYTRLLTELDDIAAVAYDASASAQEGACEHCDNGVLIDLEAPTPVDCHHCTPQPQPASPAGEPAMDLRTTDEAREEGVTDAMVEAALSAWGATPSRQAMVKVRPRMRRALESVFTFATLRRQRANEGKVVE